MEIILNFEIWLFPWFSTSTVGPSSLEMNHGTLGAQGLAVRPYLRPYIFQPFSLVFSIRNHRSSFSFCFWIHNSVPFHRRFFWILLGGHNDAPLCVLFLKLLRTPPPLFKTTFVPMLDAPRRRRLSNICCRAGCAACT